MKHDRHIPSPTPAARRRGMTLLELAAALVVITVMLSGLVGVCNALANDSSLQQTLLTMRTLNRALAVYKTAHGRYPSATELRHIETPMARCVAELRSSPSTGHLVTDLPGLTQTPDHWFTVQDGFGLPMQYIDPSDAAAAMTQRAARFPRSPGLKPFVVSAGPDGQFGDLSSADPAQRKLAADNLYSFDLESTR